MTAGMKDITRDPRINHIAGIGQLTCVNSGVMLCSNEITPDVADLNRNMKMQIDRGT